jgi:hypothetical protein
LKGGDCDNSFVGVFKKKMIQEIFISFTTKNQPSIKKHQTWRKQIKTSVCKDETNNLTSIPQSFYNIFFRLFHQQKTWGKIKSEFVEKNHVMKFFSIKQNFLIFFFKVQEYEIHKFYNSLFGKWERSEIMVGLFYFFTKNTKMCQ